MDGKEVSAPRLGPANFQDADPCPPEWLPAKTESTDLVSGWAGSVACERVCAERTKMPPAGGLSGPWRSFARACAGARGGSLSLGSDCNG